MPPCGPLLTLLTCLLLLPPALPYSLLPRSLDDDLAAHPSPDDPPCTITSPHTGSFFDLRPLTKTASDSPSHPDLDWTTSGYDYNTTFHLNICAPVLSDVSKAHGASDGHTQGNISAFYEKDGEIYSIGQSSSALVLRGKKLILEYTQGSPCPSSPEFHKSTLISFLCDRDLSTSKPDVAYLGSLNSCSYFFEIRAPYACATSRTAEGEEGLPPLSIFAVICAVFVAVYAIGGCVYQRTVMNARGWKQVPHYHTWEGMARGVGKCCGGVRGRVRLPQNSRHPSADPRSAPNGEGQSAFSRRLSGLTGGIGGSASRSAWGSWGTRSGKAGPLWARGGDEEGEVEDENRLLDQLEGEWED